MNKRLNIPSRFRSKLIRNTFALLFSFAFLGGYGQPIVEFTSATYITSEDITTVDICVDVADEDGLLTEVDVVLTSANGVYIPGFTSQTLSFSGATTSACVTFSWLNNNDCDGLENYNFELQNLSGGTAQLGSQTTTELTIIDDEENSQELGFQGFEGYDGDGWGYSLSVPECLNNTTAAWKKISGLSISNPTLITPSSGSYFFGIQDLTNTSCNGNQFQFETITFDDISTTGLTELTISFDYNVYGYDNNDDIKYELFIDGNGQGEVILVNGLSSNTSDDTNGWLTETVVYSGTPTTASLVLSVRQEGGFDYAGFDNVSIVGFGCHPCPHPPNISTFTPTEGPSGTQVYISGENFMTGLPIDDVLFNGISASSFTVLSDDLLVAEVPVNAETGHITIIKDACVIESSEVFTFLADGCLSNDPSLIISEMVNPVINKATDSFIEIYNPTADPIDLTGWTLYALINATDINDQSGTAWTLSGTIAAGQAMTCGYTSASSGGPHNFTNASWNAATNWDGEFQDGAALYSGSDLVDAFLPEAISTSAYFTNKAVYRNNDVCYSNPNSTTAEWTVTNPVAYAGFGAATKRSHSSCVPISTLGGAPVISGFTGDISNYTCGGSATFFVTATADDPILYQWYESDGSNGWTAIANGGVYSNATTNTLTISNVNGLDGYEYYCEVSTGPVCITYSETMQLGSVLPNAATYFRSIGSGLWSDPDTWEISIDFTNYSSSCAYPTSLSSQFVEIESGHTVTYDLPDTDTIPKTHVLDGGFLETQSSTHLIIDGTATGADFIIEGEYVDNGNNLNGIEFLNGATWEIGSTGTLVKTNLSSADAYRDSYEGGISAITADANWVYRKASISDIGVTTEGMVYPNLSFENDFDGSNYQPTSSENIFSGTGTPTVIKGDLNIGVNGQGTYTVRTNNTNAAPILVQGNLNLGAGSGLRNEAAISSQEGAGIEIEGNINSLGSIGLGYGTGASVGVLKLSGADDVVVSSTLPVEANHFVLDKDAGFNVSSDANINVAESAEFLNGILSFAAPSNSFYFGLSATVTGASNASYVDGKVQKAADAGTNFTFPIGNSNLEGTFYQPARIFELDATATIEAQYFIEEHPFAGAYYDGESNTIYDNHEIGNCDYWTITQAAGTGNPKLALKYTNDDSEYCNVVVDPTYMRIASLNPSNIWDTTTSGDAGDEIVMGSVISAPVTGGFYGDFTFFSDGGANLNVLPIELLSFKASPVNTTVVTEWATSTETNNDYFTIERSPDTYNFYPISTTDGAGNSHEVLNYSSIDENPLPGISYYRLKQTDFDGAFTYSDVQSVSFKNEGSFGLEKVYRNDDELNLVYKSTSPYILVEIYDILGKRRFAEVAENYGGRSVVFPNLNRGVYIIRISSGSNSDTGRIVW